jgi:hypothetical protein
MRTTIVLIVLVSAFSCKKEADDKSELILGRWDIVEASRNGRPTESLADLYFEFFQDGNMRTNLTGSTATAAYQIDKNLIKQRNSQVDADYKIESLSDSTLILTTELRGFSFRFVLGKSVMEE